MEPPSIHHPQLGSHTTPGTRGRAANYQHDRFICSVHHQATVLAVFDGHGLPHNGHLISDHCAHNFLPLLQRQRAWQQPNTTREQPDPDMNTALLEVTAQLEGESLTVSDRHRQFAGTTLCAAVIKDGFLYTANVGDSRAVLAIHGAQQTMSSSPAATAIRATQLTRDHNCTEEEEKARIERNGGFVERDRLNGDLDMSRTIGDHEFKKYRNHPQFNRTGRHFGAELLVATPDITCRKLSDDDAFVVVATDGLWTKEIHNELLVVLAEGMFKRGKSATQVAKGLSQFAMASGSTDNITVLVALLKPIAPGRAFSLADRRLFRRFGARFTEDNAAADGENGLRMPRRRARVRSLFHRRTLREEDERTVHGEHHFSEELQMEDPPST
ncbi:phosphatase 2C 4 [Gracilariopsis chorda]|uniref:Phosphatase 2C 4 n=1 Tax=Gracilariopsis chorda TaxID=448386 RepID=A0A2V3J0T8_9FLOR|nr:phosphatase 2C 4 [Gracilariopsis chorda]|eukprot:PXF48032.1 phosphatase 2C 4 [Gracilariopsis chorda]